MVARILSLKAYNLWLQILKKSGINARAKTGQSPISARIYEIGDQAEVAISLFSPKVLISLALGLVLALFWPWGAGFVGTKDCSL